MKNKIFDLKVLKRNQLVLIVVSLMLITAGYLNYTTENENTTYTSTEADERYAAIGDATFVNSGALVENEEQKDEEKTEETSNIQNENSTQNIIENETIETASKNNSTENYYTESKLQREKMYSQMLESYQKMLDSTSISEEQKAIAQTEIKKINDNKNSIMITENLLTTKGFKNVVVFINDASVSVVVQENNLSKEQVAQIQNIISREMKTDIDDIHISTK